MNLLRIRFARTPVPLLSLLLAACAIGNKYDYADAQSQLAYSGSGKLTETVHDQRPDVIEDPSEANRVGTQRNRYGIPFHVNTASGRPLADDMSESLRRALNKAGFDASGVAAQPSEAAAVVKARLLAGNPKRAVLLRMDDWNSDTLKNPTVRYDLTLSVFDARGSLLGSQHLKGEDDLKGSFFGAIKDAKKNVPLFFEKKLEQMLNSPEIRKALAG